MQLKAAFYEMLFLLFFLHITAVYSTHFCCFNVMMIKLILLIPWLFSGYFFQTLLGSVKKINYNAVNET